MKEVQLQSQASAVNDKIGDRFGWLYKPVKRIFLRGVTGNTLINQ